MILRETSITLTELDRLKEENPKRYWEFYFWLLLEKLEETRKIEELENRTNDTGSKDVGTIRKLNTTIYSEIIKEEDIKSGRSKLPD